MKRALIIGGEKATYFLAKHLVSRGDRVTIVHREAETCRYLLRHLDGAVVIQGNGSDPRLLAEAGARQADLLIALTTADQDNLVACQLAQRMFGVPRTIALVNDPENEEIFHRLGVSAAFSATRIIAALLEEQTEFAAITDLFPVAEGRIRISEVALEEDAPALGIPLRDLGLPEGVLVAGILRGDEIIVPKGDSKPAAGDRLVLVSQPENLDDALRLLVGESA
jgi:trk system potassium uptake protein TrkA